MKAQYVRLWRRVILAGVGGLSIAVAILMQFSRIGIDLRSASTMELFALFGLIAFPAITMIVLRMDRDATRRRRRLQAG
jgi:hypothetical protein